MSTQDIVNLYLEETFKKHVSGVTIKTKSQSLLLKLISPVIKVLFNPRIEEYIQTIGKTIYVPETFMKGQTANVLSVISHECRHAMDYSNSPVQFVLSYGFPQIFAIPLVLLLLLFGCGWWALLGLLLLLPLPAPWRYLHELRAYRTRQLMLIINNFDDSPAVDNIVKNLSEKWYYWTWPFPEKIKKDLRDMSYVTEPFYQDLAAFCKAHNVNF